MKRRMWLAALAAVALGVTITTVDAWAQAPAAPAAPAADAAVAPAETTAPAATATTAKRGGGFWQVVFGSGWLGVILWIFLFGSGGAGAYFVVDCAILVQAKRIMPQGLIDRVNEAMGEGDVLKALHACESEPGALANILTAGFSHVEEGFEVIQEAVTTAADFETEKLIQRITWISVCANVAPMLGLLGTVQGMILCFENLATGAVDIQLLALAIGQALYTTAAGLTTAIPCVTAYYIFRNAANRIVLRMEAMTMELIKDLRNVEVVEE